MLITFAESVCSGCLATNMRQAGWQEGGCVDGEEVAVSIQVGARLERSIQLLLLHFSAQTLGCGGERRWSRDDDDI